MKDFQRRNKMTMQFLLMEKERKLVEKAQNQSQFTEDMMMIEHGLQQKEIEDQKALATSRRDRAREEDLALDD